MMLVRKLDLHKEKKKHLVKKDMKANIIVPESMDISSTSKKKKCWDVGSVSKGCRN